MEHNNNLMVKIKKLPTEKLRSWVSVVVVVVDLVMNDLLIF